jgi:hypothetical protein
MPACLPVYIFSLCPAPDVPFNAYPAAKCGRWNFLSLLVEKEMW